MKIGTSLIMIVTILISFGFVLADNLHVRQNLQETERIIAEAQSSNDATNQELEACKVISANQESELQRLRFENSKYIEKISQLESEKASPDLQNNQLQASQSDDDANINPIATIIIVITQIALFFMQKLQQTKIGFHMPLVGNNKKGQSVRLTEEELKIIIQMRRKK